MPQNSFFPPRPEARPTIYEYSDSNPQYDGQPKVGYTTRWRRQNHDRPPHFVWNAQMRFGKTFAAYQLARRMAWRRILVVTFNRPSSSLGPRRIDPEVATTCTESG